MRAPLIQSLIFRALHLPIDPPSVWLTAIYGLIIIAAVFLPFVSAIAMFCIWLERKLAGHFQSRIGPNRVGPFGLLQSIADGVKLLLKEDLLPSEADETLMRLAPYLVFAPVFVAFVALPFAPDMTFEPRLSVGLFLLLAILSVEVMGVILAGWASNNKWSVYGAMREACQMVSYEIPLGLSIIIGVMAAGTLNLVTLGFRQGGGIHTWLIFRNPFTLLAFFTYFIASLASNKRAPFDLPESESELVAGYHTEYSGLRFSFFLLRGICRACSSWAAFRRHYFLAGGTIRSERSAGRLHTTGRLFDADPTIRHALPLLALQLGSDRRYLRARHCSLSSCRCGFAGRCLRPRIDQVLYACVKGAPADGVRTACSGAALWELFVPGLNVTPWNRSSMACNLIPGTFRRWHDAGAIANVRDAGCAGVDRGRFVQCRAGLGRLRDRDGSRDKTATDRSRPDPSATKHGCGSYLMDQWHCFICSRLRRRRARRSVWLPRGISCARLCLCYSRFCRWRGCISCSAAEFLAAVQLVVYAGGTLILIVFGVMLTSKSPMNRFEPKTGEVVLAIVGWCGND